MNIKIEDATTTNVSTPLSTEYVWLLLENEYGLKVTPCEKQTTIETIYIPDTQGKIQSYVKLHKCLPPDCVMWK